MESKTVETSGYSYLKLISDEEWGLLEIIPNNIEPKKSTQKSDIIKLYEENKEDDKPKLIDANSKIRKNVLKGFGTK